MKAQRTFLLLVFLGVGQFCTARTPNTLDDFVRYADSLPELTPWMGNWTNPDFEPVYLSQRPGPFTRFIRLFNGHRPEWTFTDFEAVLKRVLATQSSRPRPDKVLDLVVNDGVRIVFWGDLHGAYHSFLRDLKELELQGMITQDLHIAKGCYFILLGDDITRSPYSLQQLTLEFLLFERNPDQFIYLSSPREQEGGWRSSLSVRRPLIIYGGNWWDGWSKTLDAELPLEQEMGQFFNGCPQAVVLRYADGTKGQIYCAQDMTANEITLSAKTRAIIVGETRRNVAKGYTGLDFVGYDYGSTYWSLLSSPIKVYQDHLDFYHDSFAILTMGKTLRDAYLTHYYRDTRDKGGFKTAFGDVVTGMVRQTLQEIRVCQQMPLYRFGSSTALIGGYGAAGVPIKQGIEAACVQINREGGVNGHLLYPIVLDDEYTGRLAAINARKLTDEYGVDVFVSPQGTPTLNAYLDRVQKGEIAVLFPRSGAIKFYNKELTYLINSIASVGDEVHALMDQMVNEFKIRTFAFVYPNDSFGLPFMETVKNELKKYGITTTYDIVYQHGQTDFTDQMKKTRESLDDGVGIFMTGNAPVREFLSGLGMEFFLSKAVFMTSFLDSVPFNQFVDERGIKFTMSYPVPDPRAVDLPIFQDFNRAMKLYGLSYNASLFEGYLAVKLLADALKHLKPPFTKEAILHYFEGLKNYSFGGIDLTFNPETRDFGMPVFIITSEDRWVKYQNRRRVAEGSVIKKTGDSEKGGE